METAKAPAETYTLNVMASALGRFAIPRLDNESVQQSSELLGSVADILSLQDAPPVPHTDPELLRQTLAFDTKLITQLTVGPASERIDAALQQHALRQLTRHHNQCKDLQGTSLNNRLLVEPQEIADAYGLPDLWNDPQSVVNQEIKKYGKDTQHPDIPSPLLEQVTLGETQDLLHFMWDAVIQPRSRPHVTVRMTDKPSDYHVFWAPTAGAIDYATPTTYNRATQLSFDMPHNATHLAHLDILRQDLGAHRYDDSMQQRAYFEALTVFSEYITMRAAEDDPTFGQELAKVFKIPADQLSTESLAKWIADDRRYEFKLRAVRLMADSLMVQGYTFDDAVSNISEHFGIPETHARAETAKYLPWTGLGGVYTHGYRKLLALGKSTVQEAFFEAGEPRQTWAP